MKCSQCVIKDCLCERLSYIAIAQGHYPFDITSCQQSMRELTYGLTPRFDTIPLQFILKNPGVTSGTSDNVLIGRGYRRNPINRNQLEMVPSTWFRVRSVDIKRCCAVYSYPLFHPY